jgi:O-antigen ligase
LIKLKSGPIGGAARPVLRTRALEVERWFRAGSALALGAALIFAVSAFAATEAWARSLFQMSVLAIASCWAARMAIAPYPLVGSLLLIPLAGAVAWGWLQLLAGATVYRFVTLEAALNWSTYFLLFLIALQVFADPEVRRLFLRSLLYFGFVLCIVSVLQYFTARDRIYWIFPVRSGSSFGPFVNRDHYAVFAELLLPIALVETLRDRPKAVLHASITGALFASVFATGSRASAILIGVQIIVLLCLSGRAVRRTAVKVGIAIVLFTALVGLPVLRRQLENPDVLTHRREMLLSALQMTRDRPWMGFGLGTFEIVYPAYAHFDSGARVDHAHNDWAEWAAEGGLPFCLMLLGLAGGAIRPAFRSLWGLGILSVFIHSLVDFPMQIPALAALQFVMLGALAAYARERRAVACARSS